MLPYHSIFVCSVYIRPVSHPDKYIKHAESVQQLLDMAAPCDTIIVMGLPDLVWDFDEDVNGFLPINASTDQELAVVESLLSKGLKQINNLVMRTASCSTLFLWATRTPWYYLNRNLLC